MSMRGGVAWGEEEDSGGEAGWGVVGWVGKGVEEISASSCAFSWLLVRCFWVGNGVNGI